MLVTLFGSALAGCFLYYALLIRFKRKSLPNNWVNWFCCTGFSAFLLAISCSVIAHHFGATATIWLSVAMWPFIFFPLHIGYIAAIQAEIDPGSIAQETDDS